MRNEKLNAFVGSILLMCECEGFTVAEVYQLPQLLRHAVEDRMMEIRTETKFSIPQADK